MADTTLKTIVTIYNIRYPKGTNVIAEGTWGIIDCYDIKNKNNLIITGNLPALNMIDAINGKQEFSLIANLVKHKTYGWQYQIIYMQPNINLQDTKLFKTFLSYVATPLQVEALFNGLDDPLNALKERDVEKLCTVKGIGKVTAYRLIERYEENALYEQAYVELGEYGLTANLIKKIVNTYKSVNKALAIIRENPYSLIKDVDGIGWAKADAIGIKVGFALESVERLEGFLQYYLDEQGKMGNSWINPNLINSAVMEIFTTSFLANNKATIISNLATAVAHLKDKDILVFDDEKNRVYLSKYYRLEKNIACELIRLMRGEVLLPRKDIDEVIDQIEFEKGYRLTDEQTNGARIFKKSNVGILTGASGTGKSTSIDAVIRAFKGYKIAQCALSGRAASRLGEITGLEGQTIHRLLEWNGDQFGRDNLTPIEYDVVILDETSMLGGELFYSLIRAIRTGAKLIMVGDTNQLESLGSLNLFEDLINSKIIPCQILSKIHRQAQASGIITESFKVKDGIQISSGLRDKSITHCGTLKDLVIHIDNNNTLDAVISHFKEELSKVNDINKIQVIVPMREKGDLSVSSINKIIQEYYNPASNHTDKEMLTLKSTYKSKSKSKGYEYEDDDVNNSKQFRVGDKVINVVNTRKVYTIDGNQTSIFNGFIGIIKSVDNILNEMIVDFGKDVGEVVITSDIINNIQLAYAITCHKFQGSETDIIITGLNYGAYTLLCRQWVYTAITRAKKKSILCCENDALKFAIGINRVSEKKTFLKELLKSLSLIQDDVKQ